MKRMHIHLAVEDLKKNIAFYSGMFGSEPTVEKEDYAKWKLDDPAVNFAISSRGEKPGLNHLGIQTDSDEELEDIAKRLDEAEVAATKQDETACCYAKSNKYWAFDPQGIPWESFNTLSDIPTFGDGTGEVPDDQAVDLTGSSCVIRPADEVKKSSSGCCPG